MFDHFSVDWRRSHLPESLHAQTASACVPLHPAWISLMRALHGLGGLIVEARHRHARLVTLRQIPELYWDNARLSGWDEGRFLRLHTQHWARAHGWKKNCDCCGSPGSIVFQDATGGRFCRISAPASVAPKRWAHLLEEWRCSDTTLLAPFSGNAAGDATLPAVPLPETACAIEASHPEFITLLQMLVEQHLAVTCILETPGVRLSSILQPAHFVLSAEMLSIPGSGVVAQVQLPAINGLAFLPGKNELHLVGPAGESLLAFGPNDSVPRQARQWESLFRSTFGLPH